MNKICHLTSAHARDDIRIFKKECISLKNNGYNVSLIVADGKGDDVVEGVKIYDIGKLEGRLNRFIKTTKKIYKKAVEINADLYHFHDPDLMPAGFKLIKKGKYVIYDVHEDLPGQTMGKPYIKPVFRKPIALALKTLEHFFSKRYSYIITATPHIKSLFDNRNKAIDINNYPFKNELLSEEKNYLEKKQEVCFVGAISEIRGLEQVVNAMDGLDVKLNLAGKSNQVSFRDKLTKTKGWNNVNELGLVTRQDVKTILANSKVGIVTYLPSPNHIYSQPNKLFEYMSAGIPVIASNFDLWKQIVEDYDCGICVDPESSEEIRAAIKELIDKPKKAQKMGENGKKAVMNKFNWASEEKKLIKLYEEIL
ncbi:glycosyltransferase family 4 protein [Psychroserpens sp. NJDZ02]|uniref:glycosyltransferase family 4 protein n=1 Tax=Psychroserpens sp. NJDZ02 TaxID=2570561 RepID=UPI0010A7B694|nr:glycosyltransferase family 4 protein [Psychroserpens sp. NJDZ02]QCE41152.1 glycosyltransferase family 4 protein [Psychroserpens sp. NJDZ02]